MPTLQGKFFYDKNMDFKKKWYITDKYYSGKKFLQ